ncbi:MAG: Ig-like domain-containing protein [Clostridiales bacterium]|nr:Ig-like domain-containing protein [Clostridiales bacterium]
MKKRTISLLAIVMSVLLSCLLFAACEEKTNPPSNDTYTYTLNATNKTMAVGDTTELKVTVTPEKEIKPTWSVTASNPAGVVTVDNKGVVKAEKEGTATVTATVDGKKLNCAITVLDELPFYSYEINFDEANLEKGKTLQLEISCEDRTDDYEVTWQSDATDVATVSNAGVVTGVKEGDAEIAALVDGEEVAWCTVHVFEYKYTVSENFSVRYGATGKKVEVSVSPERATNFSFTSSNESVVVVDIDGNIETKGIGTATITVKDDGVAVGACEVTVEPNIVVHEAFKLHSGETRPIITVDPEGYEVTIDCEVTEGDDVVEVTPAGMVTALKNGTAKITVTVDGEDYECTVTVADVFTEDFDITLLDMDSRIDITEGAEYWEQYIVAEVNHKKYNNKKYGKDTEDIISLTFPVTPNPQNNYLSDFKAWLDWHGGANADNCDCGLCNKDTQNGGDGGQTGAGTKSYKSADGASQNNTEYVFDFKVYAGASVIKVYTGSFKATVDVKVYIDGDLYEEGSFTHSASLADLVSFVVDANEAKTVQVKLILKDVVDNGFISIAAASVSGPVYELEESTAFIGDIGGTYENIVIKKDGVAVTEGVTYDTENSAIATVSAEGVVTATGKGTTNITVTVDGRVRKLTVKVGYTYSINSENVSLMSSKTHQIVVYSNPEGSVATATYQIDTAEQAYATVSDTGLITGIAEGTAHVRVDIDGYNFTVTVTVVDKVAANASTEEYRGKYINLMAPDVMYWEYILYGEISAPADKTGEADLITDAHFEGLGGENNGFGAFIWFENGRADNMATYKTDSYNGDAWKQYTKGTKFTFTVKLPDEGHYQIRVYTGAWENSANKVTLLDGEKELATTTLEQVSGGRSTLVTFDTTTAEATSLSLKLEAVTGDNIRLMAIAIVDADYEYEATTTVTYNGETDKVEMTGTGDNQINLSEKGNLDWIKYLVENVNGGDKQNVRKSGESHLIGDLVAAGGEGWDYRAGIYWDDNDGEYNSTACADGDNIGEGKHNNFYWTSDIATVTVKVDSNVDKITLYLSSWNAEYGLIVEDSNHNAVLAPTVLGGGSGTAAFEVTLNITATAEDNLTIRLFKTGGENCGVAAIAVHGTAA